jgi:hypothetical protein
LARSQFVEVDDGIIDPRGAWSCVFYGNPALGDERVLLNFAPDQSTLMARPEDDDSRPWSPLSPWQIEDNVLTFRDSRTGRQFDANLERTTLGGSWKTLTLTGGWWCTQTAENVDLGIFASERDRTRSVMAPLIPAVMATPRYPRRAIRDALEGRAVICFEVDPNGQVRAPEFIELSDEVFRAPSLDALMTSSYRPLTGDSQDSPRPACRSFIYRLDQIF